MTDDSDGLDSLDDLASRSGGEGCGGPQAFWPFGLVWVLVLIAQKEDRSILIVRHAATLVFYIFSLLPRISHLVFCAIILAIQHFKLSSPPNVSI
jgi:hypothetical protein